MGGAHSASSYLSMYKLNVIKQGQRVSQGVRPNQDMRSITYHPEPFVALYQHTLADKRASMPTCNVPAATSQRRGGLQRSYIARCIACHARPVLAVAAVRRPPLQAARLHLLQVSKPLPQRRHRSRCARATSQKQPENENVSGERRRVHGGQGGS